MGSDLASAALCGEVKAGESFLIKFVVFTVSNQLCNLKIGCGAVDSDQAFVILEENGSAFHVSRIEVCGGFSPLAFIITACPRLVNGSAATGRRCVRSPQPACPLGLLG